MIAAAVHSEAGFWIGILLAAIILGGGIFENFTCDANPQCARGLMFIYAALLILVLGTGFVREFPDVPHVSALTGIAALPLTVTGFILAVIGLRQQNQHRRFRRGTVRGVVAVLLSVPALLGLPALGFLEREFVTLSVQSGAIAATTPVPLPDRAPAKPRATAAEDTALLFNRPFTIEHTPPPPPAPAPTPAPTPMPPHDPDGTLVFVDQNFKLTVPPHWSRVETARLNPAAAVALQCESPQSLFMAVVEKPGIESGLTTETLVTLAKAHLKGTDANAAFPAEKTEKINGADFAMLESVVHISELSLFYVHRLSFTNGIAYQLVAWGQEKDRDAVRAEAEKIAAGFKILDPELKFHKPGAPPK